MDREKKIVGLVLCMGCMCLHLYVLNNYDGWNHWGQPNSWQVMSWLFLCLDVVSSITTEWLWMELIVKNDRDAVCSKQ